DHRPNAVVAVGLIERLDQLANHRRIDGVEAVGPVEGDRGHPVGHVVEERLERHQKPSARRSSRAPAATGSGAASGLATNDCSAGITSAAKRRMLRSASSYGIPA